MGALRIGIVGGARGVGPAPRAVLAELLGWWIARGRTLDATIFPPAVGAEGACAAVQVPHRVASVTTPQLLRDELAHGVDVAIFLPGAEPFRLAYLGQLNALGVSCAVITEDGYLQLHLAAGDTWERHLP